MDSGGAEILVGEAAPAAFSNDPLSYLSAVTSASPSYQALDQLAGGVAKWFSNKSPKENSLVAPAAAAYLQSAAMHLQETGQPAGNAQLEADSTKKQYEVVTAVGVCATLCREQRGAIGSSGILPTLANLLLNSQSQGVNQLSLIAVEFLQCALMAEQYRYAARLVSDTWPRPDMTVNVKLVLRYFYLRGMIHAGCDDFVMAHRCFWTCLSIPAEVTCKIAIEAWKKLVLVQCIMNDSSNPDADKTTLPKSMPNCIGRLLASSKEASSGSSASTTTTKGSGTKRPQPSTGFSVSQQQPSAPASRPNPQQSSQIDSESTSCYMDITQAFYKRDKAKLELLMRKHSSTFQGDGNTGLLEQCHTRLIRNQVRHLSKMYSVVSVTKAANLLGITNASADDVSQQVAALLLQSGVVCDLQEDEMIVFHDEEEQEDTSRTPLVDLSEWMSLLENIQRMDVNILTSARYQSLMRKESSSGGDAKTAAAAAASGPRGVDEV